MRKFTAITFQLLLFDFICITVAFSIFSFGINHTSLKPKISSKNVSICELPLAVGDCTRSFPRFYFNKATNKCYKFSYSGCEGNGNRFISKKQCRQRCLPKPKKKARLAPEVTLAPKIVDLCETCAAKNAECIKGQCVCRKGYEMKRNKCVDINECEWENCEPNALCVNTEGSFHCECKIGYAGSGRNCTMDHAVCGQNFDKRYETLCYKNTSWEIRYFYDQHNRQCRRFWYGGCQFSRSQNFFADAQTCLSICNGYHWDIYFSNVDSPKQISYVIATSTPSSSIPDLCYDSFDQRKRQRCEKGVWRIRYYFHPRLKKCTMFYFDESCSSTLFDSPSRNIFVHLSTCKRVCEPDSRKTFDDYYDENFEAKRLGAIWASFSSGKEPEKGKSKLPASPKSVVDRGPTYEVVHVTPRKPAQIFGKTSKHGDVTRIQSMVYTTISPESRRIEDWLQYGVVMPDSGALSSLHAGSPADARVDVRLTAGISSDCLDSFDPKLTHQCSIGKPNWRIRFYYDSKSLKCKMFWYDGCPSDSRNIFEDIATCKWKCQGMIPPYEIEPTKESCLDNFDSGVLKDCNYGRFEVRYFFNHYSKRCELFYYGGCHTESKNIFVDYDKCVQMCQMSTRDISRICSQPFDSHYQQSCSDDGVYAQYYYYDQKTKSCRTFWYGNCKGRSENIFATMETCQWVCERKRERKIPSGCLDKFDETYRKSCRDGKWVAKWYFDHVSGACQQFWYDGCVSSSQNIYPDEESCKNLCELPALPIEGLVTPTTLEQETYRCLETFSPGNCSEHYSAYFYNTASRRCEPFQFTGCDGNGNRFVSARHCEQTCYRFRGLNEEESNCFQPLDVGYGRSNSKCFRNGGFKFYYNSYYGRCGHFWYFGCGGNKNRFDSYMQCEKSCQRGTSLIAKLEKPKPISVCFLNADGGKCSASIASVKKWTYMRQFGKCIPFEFAGCGGNENRFDTQHECEWHCRGLIAPQSNTCAFFPDIGPCNRLREMWYYDMSLGKCEKFHWGGCSGNTNRFESEEICMNTCVPPVSTPISSQTRQFPTTKPFVTAVSLPEPCRDKLDHGRECENYTIRYHYEQKSKSCQGFFYTGCGTSQNNFPNLKECESVCVYLLVRPSTRAKIASTTKTTAIVRPTLVSTTTRSTTTSIVTTSTQSSTTTTAQVQEIKSGPELQNYLRAVVQNYVKGEGQWIDENQCIGFKYNISGAYTKLNSFMCLMEEGGSCQVQALTDTGGKAKCRIVRSWLKGRHLYSWFFTVDHRPNPKINPPTKFKKPLPNDSIATVDILPLNDCHKICQ